MVKKINMYTDGSCIGNPGPGGWAVILQFNNVKRTLSGGEKYSTNNKMELTAVIKGLQQLKEQVDIQLYTDSQYVSKGINEWLPTWVNRNFKGVKNPDLWREYIIQINRFDHKINATWVKGHAGHPENEICDKLAFTEANKYKT